MSQELGGVERTEWRAYFDQITKEHEGDTVTMEVVSREFGDQFEAEELPLAYLEYDHKDDVFIVAVGGRDGKYPVVLNHMIWHPTQIEAELLTADGPLAVQVVDPDGVRTIVTLHRPPGAEAAAQAEG